MSYPLQLNETYPTELDLVVAEVIAELQSASAKHPPIVNAHHGYAVLKEEVDEMWDDIKRNNAAGVRAECIQVAAMAIRFLLDVE